MDKPEMVVTYQAQGEVDAENILRNNADEIAEALAAWYKDDQSQSFQPHQFVAHADMWVHEQHHLSGYSIDMKTAVEILEQVPEKYHETDPGQWRERTAVKTVIACGISTYCHYVECLFSECLQEIAEKARTAKLPTHLRSLTKNHALKIIDEYLEETFE